MIKDHIYLAGPIEDVSHHQMTGWRIQVKREADESGIKILDPTRRITFHDQLEPFVQDTHRSMNICKRIFKQDLQDIADSRVIIADVRRSSGRGTGTSCELMFAHVHHKIIILWADEEDFPHPFLEAMATEKHYKPEDAIKAALSYY